MGNAQHLEILYSGADEWNTWRRRHPEVRPNLRGADLRRLPNLQAVKSGPGRGLRPKFSKPLNLSNCELRNADLRGLYLTHSTLKGSDLRGARLQETDVAVANFSNTNMRNNDMEGLNLFKIILCDADLRKANLRGSHFYRAIIDGSDFRGADLTGADLSVHSAIGAKFHKAILVDFKFADERESDLLYDQVREALIVELAMADGLESTSQRSLPYVQSYMERAFRWAHNPGILMGDREVFAG